MKTTPNNNRNEIQEELDALAPNLARIEKQEPNEVAGYYFNTLSDKVLKRVKEAPVKAPSWLDVLEQHIRNLLSPAVIKVSLLLVVVGTVGINIYKYNTAAESPVNFAALTDDDFEMLFSDNLDTEAGLLLTEADMDALSSQSQFNAFESNLDDESFDEFFIDEINESLILEEIL